MSQRLNRLGVLALVVAPLLFWATEVQARTVVVTSSDLPLQEWVDAARVPTPEETVLVTVDAAACPGSLGCALPGAIELSPMAGRKVFLHELGHIFDMRHLTDEDRAAFLALIRHTDFAWWGSAAEGYDYERMGAEWFADAYAQCARLPRIDPAWDYSVHAGLLKGRRLRATCALIRDVV
jgi:hypothetical protein